jgi:hypothetical protein
MYLVDLLAVIRSEKPTSTDSAHPYQTLGAKEGLLLRRLQVGLAATRLNGSGNKHACQVEFHSEENGNFKFLFFKSFVLRMLYSVPTPQ